MTTWIARFEPPDDSADDHVRVAVKDAIDMAGVVTTAGSVAVRNAAAPALADADCLAGARAAGAYIVGKTNLTELCLSPVGDNEGFGTPVNPLAPELIPGGSSSGSAVAVATGEVDFAYGTDTGGSVRIPAACCGIVGLKTTWGRIPTGGVWPLAPSLDIVGPIARDVSGIVAAMRLLEPGFTPVPAPAGVVGRLRIPGVRKDVEEAVDAALGAAGLTVREVRLRGWESSFESFETIVLGELWRCHRRLLDADGLGVFANRGLVAGSQVSADALAEALAARGAWQREVTELFDEVELLALPTLVAPPPSLTDFVGFPLTQLTAPINLAGVPALALPVPQSGSSVAGAVVPPSLQLVGPVNGEELLCATGLLVERALT
ncbi:amidase [Micromonospora sp. NPDC050397]|uniref:amidase n=1 Tax=Micromonospora sp. NPDC050397 TaxID=3364279 RepID=UPI00384F1D31